LRQIAEICGACVGEKTILIAIFADIHANREAFNACLADTQRNGFDRSLFLGDLVGYGADPDMLSTEWPN
jgi:predicted phosphodiesterase